MPKVNITGRKIFKTGTSSVITRRKRLMIKAKQQQQLEDETSSSSVSDFSPMNSNTSPVAHFTCDIDECSRVRNYQILKYFNINLFIRYLQLNELVVLIVKNIVELIPTIKQINK
jgi:hypothetical protein